MLALISWVYIQDWNCWVKGMCISSIYQIFQISKVVPQQCMRVPDALVLTKAWYCQILKLFANLMVMKGELILLNSLITRKVEFLFLGLLIMYFFFEVIIHILGQFFSWFYVSFDVQQYFTYSGYYTSLVILILSTHIYWAFTMLKGYSSEQYRPKNHSQFMKLTFQYRERNNKHNK